MMTWKGVIGTRNEGQRWIRTCTMTLTRKHDKHGTYRESNDPYVVIWRWFGQDKDIGARMTRRWWHDNRQAKLMTKMVAGMIK